MSDGTPSFTLIVAEDQARLIPQTATIVVPFEKQKWLAVIAEVTRDQQGQVVHELTAPKGGPVCGLI